MTTLEKIQSDIEMIEILHDGGMGVASKNLLYAVVNDYRQELDEVYKYGVAYLVETLLPRVKGRGEGERREKTQIILEVKDLGITWKEWLSYFPGSSVEILEDKQGGRSDSLSLNRLETLSRDDFYAEKTGLFYSPNGFGETVMPGKKRRRTQDNLKQINAFFVDMDGASSQEQKNKLRSKIATSPVTPSFIVETKNGFHVIWLLDAFYGPEGTGRWKNIQRGLIGHFQADRACSDVSRLLRMPSSWHCKDLWSGGEAFWVKLVYRNEVRYSMDDFAMFEVKEKKNTYTFDRSVDRPGEIVKPQAQILGKGNRHAVLKEETARAYARIGTNKELARDVRVMMKEWYRASCVPLKSYWEREVDQYCDWVELSQFGSKIS